MSSSADKPRGFAVTDRRPFTEGEDRGPEAPEPPAPEAEAAPPGAGPRLPAVDFATFVLSLGSSALMHLGEVEHPGSGSLERNLPMAKHTIDILSMLQAKTKGNLDGGEADLLENLLYDLRLRYVEVAKSK